MSPVVRERGEQVRRFILGNIENHPGDICGLTAKKFGISRQAVGKHLRRLLNEGAVKREGQTRGQRYSLCTVENVMETFEVRSSREDEAWTRNVLPRVSQLPENTLKIWHYGFTEMFNNVIDHSGGTHVTVSITRTANATRMMIVDDGVGIFKKIQHALNLQDARHAVLELAKGKFTTDPAHHSGEGIFFASRMFDGFQILSEGVFFSHHFDEPEDWITNASVASGTIVAMQLNNHTSRTVKKVFDQFSSKDDFKFNRTVVPVKMAEYGDASLISRSQAKRMLARLEKFHVVILDFEGVKEIGQAFSDEVFRVFKLQHPEIEVHPVHANSSVRRMVSRVSPGESNKTPILSDEQKADKSAP